MYLNNFKEIFENDKLESSAELKKKYLSKIFLKKTGYVIEDNIRVEQDENIEEPVMNFYKAIQHFKSGQVYEVLVKK